MQIESKQNNALLLFAVLRVYSWVSKYLFELHYEKVYFIKSLVEVRRVPGAPPTRLPVRHS
jgi:hypothetical protein